MFTDTEITEIYTRNWGDTLTWMSVQLPGLEYKVFFMLLIAVAVIYQILPNYPRDAAV